MGHDVHFLERLERVDVGQAERALGLYRNPELVKSLLAELKLPAGADRVAIALEGTEPSPHVIVSRDGHFVTCLAPEMSLGSAFRVGRATLDGVRARHERLQTALHAAESGGARDLFKHLVEDPEFFSREDAEILGAIHPLMGQKLGELSIQAFEAHQRLSGQLRSGEQPQLRRPRLKQLWRVQWILSVLAAATMAQDVPSRVAASDELARAALRLWMRHATRALALRCTGARGLWALGRVARHALPELKRMRAEPLSPSHLALIDLTLGLVGLRYPKYRAEITKVLQTVPDYDRNYPGAQESIAAFENLTREPLLKMLADPEKAEAASNAFLEAQKEAEFPDTAEAAGTLYFMTYATLDHHEAAWPYECLTALPWLTKARFEDLFPARATFESDPVPGDHLEYLAGVVSRLEVPHQEPVRAQPQVGRNEPCPCGSGKKSKKCCAA